MLVKILRVLRPGLGESFLPAACQTRHYGVHGPPFLPPVVTPVEYELKKQDGTVELLDFAPIAPAKTIDSPSLFQDDLVKKFVGMVMWEGNRKLGRQLVEDTFKIIKMKQLEKYHTAAPEERGDIDLNPLNVFHRAMKNVRPYLDLTPIKRGGVTYQVPIPVTEKHSRFMGMKWMILAARDKGRNEKLPPRLAQELLAAAANEGRVVQRKKDLHRQCEANKAFAHYRWS